MKLFHRVLLMLSLSIYSFHTLNAQAAMDPINIPDATAFPDRIIAGKSEGMGLLEFIIRDEFRDPYANPAKVYGSHRSSIVIAPSNRSLWFNSEEEIRRNGESLARAEQDYRYRTHILPIAGTLHTDSFYAGGYAAYLNYKENFESVTEQTDFAAINKDETTFKGFEATLYTGFFLGDNTTAGVSYSRSRIENDPTDTILNGEPDINRKEDLIKLGLGSRLGRTQFYLLFSGFRSSQRAEGGNLASHAADEEGIAVQSEIHIPVSEPVVLAARIGASRIKTDKEELYFLSSGNSRMVFAGMQTGNRVFLQAGIGIRYSTGNLELAAESEYQPLWVTSESEIDEAKLEMFSGIWRLGTGVNVPLSETVSWQAGLSYNFIKTNMNSTIQDLGSNTTKSLIINPARSSSVFLTTGVTYQASRHITLGYSFNYNNIPRNFSSTFNNLNRRQILTPVINRLVLRYKF